MKHTNLQELKHSLNGVLIYTDMWDKEAFKISKLQYNLYIRDPKQSWKSPNPIVLLEIDLDVCTKMDLSIFFKKCADLVVKYPDNNELKHTQFAAILENGEEAPIKWFWINTDPNKPTIGHDIAFDTTLICKWRGDVSIPIHLGSFRRKRWGRCKHTRVKQTKQAYKTIANLVL